MDINMWNLMNFYMHYSLITTYQWCNLVSVLALSVVHRGFKPRSGQTKDYKIGVCLFSSKHTALKRNSKDCFGRHQDNVS